MQTLSLRFFTIFLSLVSVILASSCATFREQGQAAFPEMNDDLPSHRLFLAGNLRTDAAEKPTAVAAYLSALHADPSRNVALFLGDSYHSGEGIMPDDISLFKQFSGKQFWIPGNKEMQEGLVYFTAGQQVLQHHLGETAKITPEGSCVIEEIQLSNSLVILAINSQWYLEDWDESPTINDGCLIKTREQFFLRLEDILHQHENKRIVIAMYHPLQSNGATGGEYGLYKHIFPFNNKLIPLPIVGSFINVLRKTSGVFDQDLHNKQYNSLASRMRTILSNKENVVVVGAHDASLQYVHRNGVHQVISGALKSSEPARARGQKDYSFGGPGWAVVEVYPNFRTDLVFYDQNGNEIQRRRLWETKQPDIIPKFEKNRQQIKDTSVYNASLTAKTNWYKRAWGKLYREQYSKIVAVPQVYLDTLHGGMTPLSQSPELPFRTLLLKAKNGQEYEMRALRKSATRFIQETAFKDQPIENDFRDTYTESFILDVYTIAHPYTPLAVPHLQKAVQLPYIRPELIYVPKQQALGSFNNEFGDELFYLQPVSQTLQKGKSATVDFIPTEQVLHSIHSSEKAQVDQSLYLRSRLFDMLIGDWNRGADQWNWQRKLQGKDTVYIPVARNHDYAFSKVDSRLLKLILNIPAFRHIKGFDKKFPVETWFNHEAYPLDLALVPQATWADWQKEVDFLRQHLTPSVVQHAFAQMPETVQDQDSEFIQEALLHRLNHLERFAEKYYRQLMKRAVVVATSAEDEVRINSEGNEVRLRITKRNSKDQAYFDRTYNQKQTNEIWLYTLEGRDAIALNSSSKSKIKLRLIGGGDADYYQVDNGKRVYIYDTRAKANDVSEARSSNFRLSDTYEVNTYDYKLPTFDVMAGYPMVGFNPDDGLKLGAVVNYTINGFERNPYTNRHVVGGNYFFATNGFELFYNGHFPRAFGKWDFYADLRYTSPNFAQNFFGYGNESYNPDTHEGMNYNRVRMSNMMVAPALQWKGRYGASARFQAAFRRVQVDKTPDRFISYPGIIPEKWFSYNNFMDFSAQYRYDNYDNQSKPTLGFTFSAKTGFIYNFDIDASHVPYASSGLGLTYKLTPEGKLVLATFAKGEMLFTKSYAFYQATTIGGDNDLRGYRNQRFAGQKSFFQSTDLRYDFGKIKTGIAPFSYGVLVGYDYGRVWVDKEASAKWHNSTGVGIWINGMNLITGRLSYFVSDDGPRFFVGLGFGF